MTAAEDDDFIELAPRSKAAPPACAITFSTIELRGGAARISLSFSEEAIAKLEGWPRFSVAWSAKSMTLRVRASTAGLFEAYRAQRGGRYILRTDLPAELMVVAKIKEPAPHRYDEDGKTILITAPPAFRRAAPKKTAAEMVEAARLAVPAPQFGRKAS